MFIARSSRAVGARGLDDDSLTGIESVSRNDAFKSAAFTSQYCPSRYIQFLLSSRKTSSPGQRDHSINWSRAATESLESQCLLLTCQLIILSCRAFLALEKMLGGRWVSLRPMNGFT